MKLLPPCVRNLVPAFCLASLLLMTSGEPLVAQERIERLRNGYLLNGDYFKRTFREITRDARHWTVRILHDDHQVALGAVVSDDGEILTKASQLEDGGQVELWNGQKLPFEVLATSTELDLALLKIEAADLSVVPWEDKDPELGAWLITPDTKRDPAAVGIVSVPRRRIPRNAEIYGVLGIQLDGARTPLIHQVIPNSGAEQAGLLEGDLVLQIDEEAIDSTDQMIRLLRRYRPGDTVAVKVKRGDEEMQIPVQLTLPFGSLLSRIAFQNQMGGPLSPRRDDFEAAIQHDTVLEPQNCGGPILSLDGKAIGLNIARAGRTESYALPADLVQAALSELHESLTATRTK